MKAGWLVLASFGFLTACDVSSESALETLFAADRSDFEEWWAGDEWELGMLDAATLQLEGQFVPAAVPAELEEKDLCEACGTWTFGVAQAKRFQPAGPVAELVPEHSTILTFVVTRDPETREYTVAETRAVAEPEVGSVFLANVSVHGGTPVLQLEFYNAAGQIYLFYQPVTDAGLVRGWGTREQWNHSIAPNLSPFDAPPTDATGVTSPTPLPGPRPRLAIPAPDEDEGGCRAAGPSEGWALLLVLMAFRLVAVGAPRRQSQRELSA
jgi:hypothetical protein